MTLINQQFGSLTVQRQHDKSARYWVKCSCGSKGLSSFKVSAAKLTRGEVTHCKARLHERRGR